MPNMSYCRFRNTLSDLQDCYDALSEISDLDNLSAEEKAAAIQLATLCDDMITDHAYFFDIS